MKIRIRSLVVNAAAIVLAALALPIHAQSYPTHTIRLIAPYPPGGQTDIVARTIAQPLGEVLGKAVVVENKPGANGLMGHDYVAKANPDGYTLLLGNSAMLAVSVSMVPEMPYDPLRDFAPITVIAGGPLVLEVNPEKLPIHTVAELVAIARQNPGKLNFALGGYGTIHHLINEQMKLTTGANWTTIAYKGAGPMLTELLGGQTDFTIDNIASSIEFIRSGKLRAIAVTDKTDLLPGVPTLEESGIPNSRAFAWHSVVAPRGTPPEIVAKLNTALRTVLKRPEVIASFRTAGLQAVGNSPEDFSRFLRNENEHWAQVAKASGAHLE